VAIVGVGLIGGSIGLALRQRGLAEHVVGIGRRQASLRIARRVGAVTTTTIEIAKGVADADLIVICTPVGRIVEDVKAVAAHCPEGALITDAGSTKAAIVAALDGTLPRGCRFLGCHPLAGSEKTGAAHASADLFDGRVTVITPTRNTRAEDYDALEGFWQSLGSLVMQMPPEEHDRALALTSHLPHLVAAAIASTLPERLFRLCGTGVADVTRIASGDPALWAQIFMQNCDNVAASLNDLRGRMAAMENALRQRNEPELERLLTLAKKNRDALGS
jgi:prephenate dehydrogenase